MVENKLTAKQEQFSQDIANDKFDYLWEAYNSTYSTKGWSKNAIYVEACKLRANTKVSLRIAELKQGSIKRNEVTIDQVLEQLANWLLFDPLDIVDPETDCVKSLKAMDKKARMSLDDIQIQELWSYEQSVTDPKKKVRVKIGELKKVKFIDKRATAEMFMKKFGQYVGENNSLVDNLDAIREIVNAVKKE